MSKYTNLFSEFMIGSLELSNRSVVSPMTRTSAQPNGLANERMVQYYSRFARGGFSLIITEGTYPDLTHGQAYENQPGIASEEQAAAWKPVVDAVHNEGGKIFLQIQHAGAIVQYNRYTNYSLAPSAVKPKGEKLKAHGGSGDYSLPKEISKKEMEAVIESFANAALRAKNIGFDGIEVHGANGYLLDQFHTDYTNLREDEFGGTPENRVRLSVLVLKAIRNKVGNNFVVGIRVSQGKVNDFYHKWKGKEDEAKIIFENLASASLDYIHTTEFEADKPAFGEHSHTLASLAKKYGNVPVIANGQLGEPETAEKMIGNRETDFVAIGTSALANPDWPNKVKDNQTLSKFDHRVLDPIAVIREEETY
ncbi:NADH:flavin oxidoreductase [Salipaludibacillus neizhouensis]|uniref:NADH:flavin oxidoreductase n=1 Tax=Salipaludibacillus neizhouensis TaxID=885475 RepID=A0A3A9JWD3_9BACI|nr:NADH:flavin oxidoreductase [Salipaludibacillus neizhouensis]RKL64787.1 NADH:flavin oxidoreductase [Salipaludibacillus neizhouensis]